jgi:hypothetical protein
MNTQKTLQIARTLYVIARFLVKRLSRGYRAYDNRTRVASVGLDVALIRWAWSQRYAIGVTL